MDRLPLVAGPSPHLILSTISTLSLRWMSWERPALTSLSRSNRALKIWLKQETTKLKERTEIQLNKRAMQEAASAEKTSAEYQRLSWNALCKSITGIIDRVNITNIKQIVPELFSENLIRGRGLFARSIMKAQAASYRLCQCLLRLWPSSIQNCLRLESWCWWRM